LKAKTRASPSIRSAADAVHALLHNALLHNVLHNGIPVVPLSRKV
jgi:hypothetical protein